MGIIVSSRDIILEGITKSLYEIILDQSSDPIFCFDPTGKYLYINAAFSKAFNLMPSDIIGKRIWDVFPGDEGDKRFAAVKRSIETKCEVVLDVKVDAFDGTRFYMTSVTPIMDLSDTPRAAICISKEITQRKRAEIALELANSVAELKNQELDHAVKALYQKSITDGLTTLFNRQYSIELLEHAIKKHHELPFDLIVMILDLDMFKDVNDHFGHLVGDHLLASFSKSLKDTFSPLATVGRYGGEEYILIFQNIPFTEVLKRVQDFQSATTTLYYPEIKCALQFSAGLSTYSGEGLNAIIKKADDLMYEAKRKGRNQLCHTEI